MMRFVKYHGCGNDFMIVDEAALAGADGGTDAHLSGAGGGLQELARRVCHRRLGIGADGLLICRREPLTMEIINSDGSVAPMCGNGVRCFARYCIEEGIVHAGTEAFDVHTLAGIVRARVSFADGFTAEIDMGRPDWSARAAGIDEAYIDGNGEFLGWNLHGDFGSVWESPGPDGTSGAAIECSVRLSSFFIGTYHTVVWLDENKWILDGMGVGDTETTGGGGGLANGCGETAGGGDETTNGGGGQGSDGARALYESEAIDRVGRALESHPVFTQRTNVDFARVTGRNAVEMITWERGAGLTAACGTGACAVAALGMREGRFDPSAEVRVGLLYGELFIRQDDAGKLFMRGPAERVFGGEFYL